MTNAKTTKTIHRAAALLMALFLSLSPLTSLAQAPLNPVDFILNWSAPDGTLRSSTAIVMSFPEYSDSFWLYADDEAVGQNAVLHIEDNYSQYTSFSIGNDIPLSSLPMIDAGLSPTGDSFVEVLAYDASGNVITSYRLFISRQTAQPLPPEEEPEVIPAATVIIHYVDTENREVASLQTKTFEAGTHTVYPEPSDLQANYIPYDTEPKTLMVDANGATPSDIYFAYLYQAPVISATVTVYYVGPDGEQAASPQQKLYDQAGEYMISAAPDDLLPGYTLNDADSKQVTVDQNGANPSELYFSYSAPTPVISAAVTVYFVGPDGEQAASPQQKFYDQAGTFTIEASPDDLIPGYTLMGEMSQQVMVDENGANPSEIYFTYSAPPVPEALVSIFFVNEQGGQVASPQKISLKAGEHPIIAEPYNLEPGYELIDNAPKTVIVNEQGANPAEITFIYRTALASPVDIVVRFVDMDGNPIAPDRVQTLIDGTNAVKADPIEGFDLQGEDTQYVKVTTQGAQPATVIFLYSVRPEDTPLIEEPTAPPAPKVDYIDVFYKDQYDNTFYEYKAKVVEGEESLIAVDLGQVNQEQYELNDVTQKTATIDSQGMLNPQEIVFLFRGKPQAISAGLLVYYRNESGEQVADTQEITLTQTGFNIVSPNPKNLLPGYKAVTTDQQQVLVNDDGTVSLSEITFIYQQIKLNETPEPIETSYEITPLENVYIHPHKDEINIRSSPKIDPANILGSVNVKDVGKVIGLALNEQREEWYLAQMGELEAFIKKSVTVQLTQEEVNAHFGWTPSPATQVPTATTAPEGRLIGRWGETNAAQLGFRKDPNDKVSNNILMRLEKGVKIWIYAQEITGNANELWYEAMAEGKNGYVKAEFVLLYDQEQSDAYGGTLASPVPEKLTPTPNPDEISPTPSPLLTQAPTEIPTSTPPGAITQSPQPQPYLGYALTVQQTALRTGANIQDESILATLPANTLLHTLAQTYLPNGETWHHVDVLNGSNGSGFIPDSAIRRISPTEAETYLQSAQPPTAPPTRVPDRVSGYAITLGRDVLMREYSDTNAKISRVLPQDTIVMVTGQEYVLGVGWHLVQHNGLYGFIRADQLRMLNIQETQAYLESLKQTPPPPKATLPPLSTDSLSSYGYINANKVRLRKDTNTNSSTIKYMDRNAFALVVDSVQAADGSQWYRINQNGTEGYVMDRFLSVLKLGELQQYLSSNDFQSGNSGPTGPSGGSTNITPLEDYNKVVWKNPNVQTSYEPFNPIATATPPVEAILSPGVSPVGGDFVVEASSTLDPLTTFQPMGTEAPTKKTSSFPTGLLAVGFIGILGGGGYYAYRMYQDNQRKAAQRAAQRRQQQGPQQPGRPAAGPQAPSTRPAGSQPIRPGQAPSGGSGSSPYAPAGNNQGTTAYRPTQPGQVPPPPNAQGTAAYRPMQPGQQVPPPVNTQGTTAYRPMQSGQVPPPVNTQGTTSYRPTQPGQQVTPPVNTQGTSAYRPTKPGQQVPPPSNAQGTAAYKPTQAIQGTKPDIQPTSKNGTAQTPEAKPSQPGETKPQGDAQEKAQRKRRADRHSGDDKA